MPRSYSDIGAELGALEVSDPMTVADAQAVARILGSVDAFWQFDAMAGSGSRQADAYGCWKVRRARNMSGGPSGKSPFFAALADLEESHV